MTLIKWARLSRLPGALFILLLYGCSASSDRGEKVYKSNCAGCHGAQMQGSKASALVKQTLKYGNDRNSILKTIRDGIPNTEMVKFSASLSNSEIEEVTDYILEVRQSPQAAKVDLKPLQVSTKHYKLKIERLITQGLNGPWGRFDHRKDG
jgi:cytochrome c553